MGDRAPGDAATHASSSQPQPGFVRWIWRGLVRLVFGRGSMDFEKRLQHLSKEEVAAHARLKMRTHRWRRLARAIVIYSVVAEVFAIAVAVVYTRSPDIYWKLRALRVLPAFAIPALAALVYSSCARYHKMRERQDQRTLERLRAERQAKIDELKQRTNYYATQELIQRYDLDPTAKAAAASVLAAKLGAESGINVAFTPAESEENNTAAGTPGKGRIASPGISSSGLRQRKAPEGHAKEPSQDQAGFLEALQHEVEGQREREALEQDEAIDRAKARGGNVGVWSRLAAMLVGEDPSQCYALICKHCHMHNGLAPKEDFQYITYYCPHCRMLNGNLQLMSGAAGSSTLTTMTTEQQAASSSSALEKEAEAAADDEVAVSGNTGEAVS